MAAVSLEEEEHVLVMNGDHGFTTMWKYLMPQNYTFKNSW
jgi:hypothetical protein